MRILVPPGIGDIYWVLVKLRGFCRDRGVKSPEIWIDAPNDRKRSLGFVERVPFVRVGGYHDSKDLKPADFGGWKRRKGRMSQEREEAYLRDGKHAFPNVEGFDWFISYNGSINAGRSLDEVDPDWPAEWDLGLTKKPEEDSYGKALNKKVGPYVVAAFFDAGFYRHWLRELTTVQINSILNKVMDETGYTVVLTGADWDRSPINKQLLDMNDRLVSLIGETTLDQYFGALRHSEGCIGFPAGNTMMGVVFGKPTSIIWNDFFNRKMHVNALPPNSNHYIPANTKQGMRIADDFIGKMR